MKFTGEQFVPTTRLEEIGVEINYEHWHRYLYASSFTKNKVVLDIACGEGYGSYLLAGASKRVVGVDISSEAIAHASKKYIHDNLEFKQGSVDNIPVSGKGVFDVIISFETIEHVGEEEQKTFLKEVKRLLKPNGIFIVSTPNKLVYSDMPGYKNEFHIKEFYIEEFRAFLEKDFKNVDFQGQTVYPVSYLWNPDENKEKLIEYHLQYSPAGFAPSNESKAIHYVMAWCSNEKTPPKPASLLVDLSSKAFTARDQYIKDLGGQIQIRDQSLLSLSAHLAEREQGIQSLSAQLAEREQGIQSLSAQLAEREQNIRALSAQLTDIYRSVGWRMIGVIRRIREALAPVGSTRGRLLAGSLNGLRLWRAEGFNSFVKKTYRKLDRSGEKSQDISAQSHQENIVPPIKKNVLWRARDKRKLAPAGSKRARIIQLSKSGLYILYTQGIRAAWPLVVRRLRSHPFQQVPVSYHIRPPKKAKTQQAWLPAQNVDNAPLVIPSSAVPLVSIVVVATNVDNAHYCLTALAGHSSRYEFDVIVVNVGTLDQSNKFLASVGGIQLIQNEIRKGFAAGCNAGASAAQGKYLLFLRDHIVLQPEFVNEMIDTIISNEDCGLAGAKLIEPNGVLFESGRTLQNIQRPEHADAGGDAIAPANNYLRPVVFSTSAVVVSRKLFIDAGGFDEQFDSYAEADLALALKGLGYKNYYQPLACAAVLAHAIPSDGEYTLLAHKWNDALLTQASGKGKAVLFIDTLTPTPDRDAGSEIAFNHMILLRSIGYHVTFIPAGDLSHAGKYTNDLQRLGIECIYLPHYRSAVEYITQFGGQYELVIVCRVNNAAYLMDWLRKYCPQARIIFNTIDLHYLREMRQAEIEQSSEKKLQAEEIRKIELDTMKKADYTLVISEREKELLASELPDTPIICYPLIMVISDHEQIPFGKRKDIIFIGGYQHKPNLDAVLYFVANIWPLIVERIPDIKFHIIGSEPPREILNLGSDNIIIAGHVENLAEYFNHCKLSIAPLRYGAGLKGKVGRSLGYGVPVVATNIAAEGSGLVNGQDILIANAPQSFAEAVANAYEDEALWNVLSQNGLDFFDQNYSLEAGKRFFSNLMKIINRRQISPAKIPLQLGMANSLDEYKAHLNEMTVEYPRRLEIEKEMVGSRNGFFTPGHCFVCNQDVEFYSDFSYAFTDADGKQIPNWRERMVCPNCQLNNRMRAAIQIFEQVCKPQLDDDIYLTEQKTPLYDWFQKNYSAVTGSEYLEDKIPYGNFDEDGIRNETLTGLTFHDDMFNCILSFDVFEHIPDYETAFKETLRCLKPGGRLIFTVPFNRGADKHIIRARLTADGKIEHILPPEYHGDPLNSDGVLCFYHFGWELLAQLRNLGFSSATAYLYWSKELGYLGYEQILFIAQKAST